MHKGEVFRQFWLISIFTMSWMSGLKKQYGHTAQGMLIYADMRMILSALFNVTKMHNAFTRR